MDEKKIVWPGWEIVRRIGSGSFGAVYEIQRDVFGEIEKAALKVISIPHQLDEIEEFRVQGYDDASITSHYKDYLQSIVAEYSLMAKIKGHTNVVYCDDVRYIQHDDGIGWDIYIKMELLTPLMKALERDIDEQQVVRLGEDLCKALVLCKDRNIIHRDIKPQNIFISEDGNYKLGDFGIAKTVERTSGGTKVGTYKYMAPEVFNNQPYGLASDIYALGLVMYWLLNERRTPFLPLPPNTPSFSMEEDARIRRFRGEQFPPPAHGSEELKRIVMKACAFDVNQRYATAGEMLKDLQSLRQNDVVPVGIGGKNPPVAENDATEYAGDATEYAEDATEYAEDATEYAEDATEYAGNDATEYAGNSAKKAALSNETEATAYAEKNRRTKPKGKKKNTGRILFLLISGFLILLCIVLLLRFCDQDTAEEPKEIQTQATSATSSTEAPPLETATATGVVGMYETDAKKLLEDQGFTVKVTESHSDTVAQGQVISQAPAGNTELPLGSTVTITVSTGKEIIMHPVPNLTGKTEAEAKKMLKNLNFEVETSYSKHETVAEGIVFGQSVEQDSQLAEGSLIIIEVCSGKPTADVPNVIFQEQSAAKQTLTNQGFQVEVVEEYSLTVSQGSVISQSPQHGSSQIVGSTVTIYVSKGKQSVSVTLDANGGSVEQKSVTVYFQDTYKNLPNPTRKGYSFAGWFTAKSGGNQVTSATKVTRTAAHTLYARWTADSYTVTFNANGGTTATSSKTVTFDTKYGSLPTPTRDYYKFLGWYTAASGGTKITDSSTVSMTTAQTLYAHWEQKALSGWVLASSVPSGAQVVNRKWTYTKTETTTSTNTSMSGWTQTGSSWQQTGTGTYYWCAFSSGFKTGDALYTKYHGTGAKMTSSETATTKRTVTDSTTHTYVYWHWVHNWGNYDSYNRLIADTYNEKMSNGKKAESWEAFESTTAKTKDTSANAYWYAYSSKNLSHWWMRNTVYKQTYTDYQKLFTYQKVTNGLESTTKVTESSTISNVKEYVQYREK